MKKALFLASVFLIASCSLLPAKKSLLSRQEELNEATKEVDVPTMDKTIYDQGEQALSIGDSLKAEYNFNQLVKKSPDNMLYKYKYAESLRRRGACKEATNLYDDVLAKKPDDMDATEGKALCLVSLGEFEKAGPILTDIIHKDSTRWKSINAAGLVFASNKKFKEANQYFELAADVSNNSPTVMNNQALVKALVGNFDDAIKILRDASTKAGEGTVQKRNIDLNLAMVYGISKNMDAAEATAKNWLTTPQLYNNMGIYAQLGKDPELARTYLNKALMGTPVYYDRAWENLENLNAGTASKTNRTSAAPAKTEKTSKTTEKKDKAKN